MPVELVPLDARAADREALIRFLISEPWPFHVRTRWAREQVDAAIESGAYDGTDHASQWVVADGRRIGIAVLGDLDDDSPVFDLRLSAPHRGRGFGLAAVRALAEHVFGTYPAVQRFEGQTREDNVAMRRTLLRAGFVKEAHYREGWPVEGGLPLATVAYTILRRDWQTGTTTPVPWDDDPR